MGVWLCSYSLFHDIFKEAAARADHRIEQASTAKQILINTTCTPKHMFWGAGGLQSSLQTQVKELYVNQVNRKTSAAPSAGLALKSNYHP